MSHETSAPRPPEPPRSHTRVWVTLAALGILLVILNLLLYRRQRDLVLVHTEEMLGQLAEVKAKELEGQLGLLRRGTVIMTLDEHVTHDLSVALLAGRPLTRAEHRRELARLDLWRQQHGFDAIEIVDPKLRALVSVGAPVAAHAELATLRTRVERTGEPALIDAPASAAAGDSLILHVLAPMAGDDEARGRVIAYVLFTVNATRDVFRRISWGDIHTGPEYLLVRREGDQVRFLSTVRGPVPAGYRMPLATEGLAAASAFRGETAFFNAVDPEGIPVVARAYPVPGTDWILLAEMDEDDALAPLREAQWATAILFLVLATGMLVLVRGTIVRIAADARADEADAKLSLEVSRQQYEFLNRYAQDVIFVLDEHGRIVDVNDRCVVVYGIPRRDLIGRSAAMLRSDAARPLFEEQFARVAASDGLTFETEHRRRDGTSFPVEVSARAVAQGGHRFFHSIVRDITEQREVRRSQELAASIFNASTEAMMITDAANRILEVNPAFTQITGYAAVEVAGKMPKLLSSGRHAPDFYRQMWQELTVTGHWEGEIWNRRKNGEIFAEWLVVNAIRDAHGDLINYIAQFSDVTEEKRSTEMVWRQANYDSLTQLPNRRLFRDRLEQEIKKAKRAQRSVALLFIDLDRFKEVNDTLGHIAGDRILVQAAGRIVRSVRDSDTVARLGGDEFTIVIADLDGPGRAERVAENLIRALGQPFLLDEDRVYVSASIGITTYPRDAANAETLLRNADQAMYLAKREGRGRFSVYTEEAQESGSRRGRLAIDIHQALANDEFFLHYQPVIDLHTGRIQKAEAFLRWRHPVFGAVPPTEFLPVAEETGLIGEIGDWVIRNALRSAKRFSGKAGRPFRVGVNLSSVQLQHRERSLGWLKQMQESGISGEHLLVEITESSLLGERPEVAETLAAFRAAGVEVAVDDFGTGYSSLDSLNKFHPDYLKIDRSFTHNLAEEGSDLILSEAIIAMAHKFGLRVIAEGIETQEQRELLARAGCDLGQGYLFSRPVSEDDFEGLLRNGKPGSH